MPCRGLLEQLGDIPTKGGDVQYALSPVTGEVDVLYVQTCTMRQEVEHSRPYLWQADTTFNTNRFVRNNANKQNI